jgi:tRNA (mo5U34)-methyltransferase
MSTFFEPSYVNLVDSPNGRSWFQSMPLPDGSRIAGAHRDRNVQLKLWETLSLIEADVAGRTVLDIGANDGFFTVAALLAGAARVTAINTSDCRTYPDNLLFASKHWKVAPEIIVGDFESHSFNCPFDVIFFLGVLYHVENVFSCLRRLGELLKDDGTLFLETQMSLINFPLPLFEAASDIYPTIAKQQKEYLSGIGASNFLFPNEAAMHNLACSFDFAYERLSGIYTRDYPARGVFKLTKIKKNVNKRLLSQINDSKPNGQTRV